MLNKILIFIFSVAMLWQLAEYVTATTQLNMQVRQDTQSLIEQSISLK